MTTVSWLALFLVMGLGFIAVECIIPGIGIFGILGAVFSAAGLCITVYAYGWTEFWILTAALILLIALIIIALNKSGFFKKIVLQYSLETQSFDAELTPKLMGKEGVTVTDLKPYGKADFDGTARDVFSNGEYIKKGRPVKVIQINGKNVIVKEIKE